MEFVSTQAQSDEGEMDYSLLGGEDAARGRRLFLTGTGILIAALIYLAYTSKVDSGLHLLQGLLIIVLSFLPSLFWAKSGGSRFPVFEPIMLLCANAYGMPMLNAQEQLAGYSEDVITRAGWGVIIYQITGIVTYLKTTGLPLRTPFWRDSIISDQVEKMIVYGMILSATYQWVTTCTRWIPSEMDSTLRAIFYGISILCTFVSAQRWGRGEMSSQEKTVLVVTIVPQLIFMSLGLVLIGAIGMIAIGLLGYLSGGKRVPWLAMALIFAVLAILHTGKTKMREKYWDQKIPTPTNISELPDFFTEWVEYGIQGSDEKKNASRKLLERSSLMHIFCLVVSFTPERQDYLYGSTYRHVLPQLIPRFFWPDKPRSHIATFELSKYYGLQNEEDTANTTIAFGLLTEVYANFGLIGSIFLGLFWGFSLKKLQMWSMLSPMFSFAGLFMILLTAWSFSAELTMAAWVSSFEQAIIVVIGLPMTIRALFGA